MSDTFLARQFPQPIPEPQPHASYPASQFSGDLSGAAWNCSSLWAHDECHTIDFAMKLVSSMDFLALTETRESEARLRYLLNKLPEDVEYFSRGISPHCGGIGLMINKRFTQRFTCIHWVPMETGRLARLELSGAQGKLNIYIVYLHPSSVSSQAESIRTLAQSLQAGEHNIVLGDFNFVAHAHDRIDKASARFTGKGNRDIASSRSWEQLIAPKLTEFEQGDYTFEGHSCWSRIDRAYTNLHSALIASKQVACNVLHCPRHLSEHKPIAISIRAIQSAGTRSIPPWVSQHPEFHQEVIAEYSELVDSASSPFEMLSFLKTAIRKAAKYVQHRSRNALASTTAHKLALCMSFIRALDAGETPKAKKLQKMYHRLQSIDPETNWRSSTGYQHILDHIVELNQIAVKDRVLELKRVRNDLPQYVYEQRKRSILGALKRLAPGGASCLAAVKDQNGDICCDPQSIAAALCTHWQSVFNVKETNPTLRAQWLASTRALFEGSMDELIPTREDVERILRHLPSSACGPDGIPFEAYSNIGPVIIDILLAVTKCMLQEDTPVPDDFNWAILVCIGESSNESTAAGDPIYTAENTRPISIVDASNRLIASIFRIVLERCVAHKISQMQRGFLPNRPMLRNILEVD